MSLSCVYDPVVSTTVGVGVTPCVGVGDGAGDEIVNVAEALPE